MTKKPTVAVIGLGAIGTVLATNFVKGNRSVIIADRKPEKSNTLAKQLGNLAQAADISNAIKSADVIIFAVWFDAIKELLKTYRADLAGKIVVDPSNPIAPDDNGGFKKIIGADESAGQILYALLPAGARFAKAFGTLGAASLSAASFQQPDNAVLFYATSEESINPIIESLIADSGFAPVNKGDIDEAIKLEVFGKLHEFGALGKTVTLAEAKSLLQPA